jgi:FkbM family methyltransferase
MFKRLFLSVSRKPQMRKLASQSFRIPVAGPIIRRSIENLLPRGERVWLRNEGGPAKGLWIKVEPYWEFGYMGITPEPGVAEALAKHLSEGKCFYDIGAHIGFYSMIAARQVGPTGRVVALEPEPDNVLILRENIAKNALGWVTVVPAAVWSAIGQMRFERGSDTPSRMSGKIVLQNDLLATSDEVVGCRATTLDHLTESNRPPSLVKVDVEGGEIDVLEGGRVTLARHHPVLLIEAHSNQAVAEVREFLNPFRYTVETLGGNGEKTHLCCVYRP